MPAHDRRPKAEQNVVRGDRTGWRQIHHLVQPILDDWHEAPARDLAIYPAGSEGPPHADDLMARDGRHWRRIEVGRNRP